MDMRMVIFSRVTISNPDFLSSSETGVEPGIRSWKKHWSEWARCQKAVGGIYFTKKWRTDTLQPGLEFDNFKLRLKSCIFICISWLNGSFFGGDDQDCLKEGVKTYQWHQNRLIICQLFNCLCIYSLWVLVEYIGFDRFSSASYPQKTVSLLEKESWV